MSTSEPLDAARRDPGAVGRGRRGHARWRSRLRDADRAKQLDRRALADRGRRHHDLSGRHHDRRGDAGGDAASDWQSDVAREVTIQVRPVSGRDLEADVTRGRRHRARPRHRRRARLYQARIRSSWSSHGSAPGLRSTSCRFRASSWSSSLAGATRPISQGCAKRLAAQVPRASLDDHRGWIDRMRTMAERRSPPAWHLALV